MAPPLLFNPSVPNTFHGRRGSSGPLVEFDATLIARGLTNLFENAAKYTPAGGTIRIEAAPVQDKLEVSVSDNGKGLPPGREATVFNKFARGGE